MSKAIKGDIISGFDVNGANGSVQLQVVGTFTRYAHGVVDSDINQINFLACKGLGVQGYWVMLQENTWGFEEGKYLQCFMDFTKKELLAQMETRYLTESQLREWLEKQNNPGFTKEVLASVNLA